MNVRKRITLAEWYSNKDTIEVDWPKIHQMVGQDHVEWLLKQSHDKCQLVVDKTCENFALVAEFYDERHLMQYHLMWAK